MTSTCKIFQLGATHLNGFKTPWWRLWTSCWPMELQDISAKTKRGGHYPQEAAKHIRNLQVSEAANEKSANEMPKCRLKMLEDEVVQYSKQLRNAISFHGCLGFQSALGMWYILIYIYTSILWSHHQLAILKPIRATGWIENWRIELTKKKLQKWVSSSIDLYMLSIVNFPIVAASLLF